MKLHKKNAEVPQEAKVEGSFSTVSFLEEIKPLLNEYFFGKFVLINGNLYANFPNGQTFKIAINEVK